MEPYGRRLCSILGLIIVLTSATPSVACPSSEDVESLIASGDVNKLLAEGNWRMLAGDYDNAERIQLALKQLVPGDPDVTIRLCLIFAAKGKYDRCIDEAQARIALQRQGRMFEDPAFHMDLACMYSLKDEDATAVSEIKEAIDQYLKLGSAGELKLGVSSLLVPNKEPHQTDQDYRKTVVSYIWTTYQHKGCISELGTRDDFKMLFRSAISATPTGPSESR